MAEVTEGKKRRNVRKNSTSFTHAAGRLIPHSLRTRRYDRMPGVRVALTEKTAFFGGGGNGEEVKKEKTAT